MSDPSALVSEKVDQLLAELDPTTADFAEFRGRQYDLGLAWVHFPEGSGGLGLAPVLQREIDRRLREAKAPSPDSRLFFGLTMAGPTIVTHGDEAVRAADPRQQTTSRSALTECTEATVSESARRR